MAGFIGNIGPWELILILLIAVIVVGPGKLPDVARSVGKAMGEFRRATSGVKKEFEEAIRLEEPSEKKWSAAPAQEEIIVDESTLETDDDADRYDPRNKPK